MENISPDNILMQLSDPRNLADVSRCRYCLSLVLRLSSLPESTDLSMFLPHVVNLMAHSDLMVKKSAFTILTKVSSFKSELLLLAVNTLLKDLQDSNPTIRALALRTICSVNHEAFIEHRLQCVSLALGDSSAYVRRAATVAVVSAFRGDIDSVKDAGIVNRLYELIRDSDPIVVVNSLMSLEEMLESEGGCVLNRKIVGYLLKRLDSFTAWGVGYVMRILQRYKPKTEEETLDIMNVLDPFLDNHCTTASVLTLEFFLQLIQNMPHLKDDVFQRCQNVFLHVFSSGNTELTWCLIQFFQAQKEHTDNIKKLFLQHYRSIFCKQKDPVYLKEEKLKFLAEIINEDNFSDILEEYILHSTSRVASVSLCSIKCIKKLVIEWPELTEPLLKAFTKLLKSDKSHVVSNTLQVLVTLPHNTLKSLTDISNQVCVIARTLQDPEGHISALYLLGHLDDGGVDSEVLYCIEDYIEQFPDLDIQVCSQLLHTSVQLFCGQPAKYQPLLGGLLDLCLGREDNDLTEQASFCYSVLQDQQKSASKVFLG